MKKRNDQSSRFAKAHTLVVARRTNLPLAEKFDELIAALLRKNELPKIAKRKLAGVDDSVISWVNEQLLADRLAQQPTLFSFRFDLPDSSKARRTKETKEMKARHRAGLL